MAERNRRNRERAGGRTLRRFAAAALIFLIPPGLGADSLTMTTWYPAPYGVYSQLRSTGNSYFAYQGGNVGIGTTNPVDRLNLWFNTGDTRRAFGVEDEQGSQTVLVPTGSGVANASYGHVGYNFYAASPSQLKYRTGTNNASGIGFGGDINFWTAPIAGGGTNLTPYVAMTVKNSGNVGIGTTNPAANLDIGGLGAQSNPYVSVRGSGRPGLEFGHANQLGYASTLGAMEPSGFPYLAFFAESELPGAGDTFKTRGIAGRVIYATAHNSKLVFSHLTNANAGGQVPVTDMLLDSQGNVGIGTTIPAAKLQVGSSGDGTVALANAWNTFSSRRYKENVRPIGGALGKISRLRGVEFDWKGSGKRDLGVVAEEVGQVFPEIVDYENGGRDARGLDYSKLVAPLIEAVKEQQQQIKTQSARIETLEKALAEVRKK